MKRVLLLLLAVTITFAACSSKSDSAANGVKTLIVASDCTWPPMEMLDDNKEPIGFDIDLMKAVAEAGGFNVKIQNTAWDGIFAGLASDQYDAVISSVTITDERKAKMDFSMPYINAGQVIVVQSTTEGITSLSDLKGKTAGAQIGTTGAFEIGKVEGVKKKSYDELGLAIEDLANGKIDAVVCDTPIAANYVLQTENYKGKLKIASQAFTEEFYGIVVKKGNQEVLDMINDGLKKVLDSEKNKELEEKWLR